MKPISFRPRLSSLDVFAGVLLATLGIQFQTGCSSQVTVDGNGGAGGSENPSTTSSGTGGGTTTVSSSSSSTGFIPGTGDCINPMPIIIDGVDTGVDKCESGTMRRREAVDCPAGTPVVDPCCGTCPDGYICDGSGEVACSCVLPCTNDAQCGADQLCLCGTAGGRCLSALCHTAADCAAGQECTSWDSTLGCMYLQFACTTPQDTCSGDIDCNTQSPFAFCAVQADGHRACQQGGCAIGRPFLIDGEARTAGIAARTDWYDKNTAPNLIGLDKPLRDELAAAWEHTARMEHASIAAFARFSLELLSLGAPGDLIMRTNAAMVDETNHARQAFAMASAYGDKRIGPARLAMDGAMDDSGDIAGFLRRVIREGCVGETVAAIEAGEASGQAIDPVVRQTLERIASDESEHAELAWRTVKWALDTWGADVRAAVRDEIEHLSAELSIVSETRRNERDETLLRHGVVTSEVRTSIRRAALRQVVLPCLAALVEDSARVMHSTESSLSAC